MKLLSEIINNGVHIEYWQEHSARYTRTNNGKSITWCISTPSRGSRSTDIRTSELFEGKRDNVRRQC